MPGGKYGQLVVISRSGADGKAFPMHTTKVVLKNLSENCTLVNTTHILEAGQQRALKSGDVITIVGRSLRYEENTSGGAAIATPTTSQGAANHPRIPQTVAAATAANRPPPSPVVFASGGGGVQQQRVLRRRLSRTPRNPDTARKLKLWDAHYSAGNMSVESTSDIFDESPPPGLILNSSSSQHYSDAPPPPPPPPPLLPSSDDPFATNGDSGGGSSAGAFERMALSVGRASASASASERSIRRDSRVAAEVARIMGQINEMAALGKSPSSLPSAASARSAPRVHKQQRRRSRSLDRPLPSSSSPPGQKTPAAAQLHPPLIPQKQQAAAYGSADETSRGTVGVSPQSTYSRSPTLQRQRQEGAQPQPQPQPTHVEKRPKPIVRAQTPAQFFSSLPRPLAHAQSPAATAARSRRAASSSGPGSAAGATTCLSSPLKRTLSSSSHCGSGIRPPSMLPRPVLLAEPPQQQQQPVDDDSEEVPTEPEPESESDAEPAKKKQPEEDTDPTAMLTTPENRRIRRPLLLMAQASSTTRKSVRFGPALSPEVFDAGAPPSTPLRRGTPMQMPARASSSSILRRVGSPTTRNASLAALPLTTSPSLLRSLLTPRPTRRQDMHQYIASLAALTESPGIAAGEEVEMEEDGTADMEVAVAERVVEEVFDLDRAIDDLVATTDNDAPKANGEIIVVVPAVDIESPTVLGASPADRRQRRRRSVRLAINQRRATLDSPLRTTPIQDNSPTSSLIVKRSMSVLHRPNHKPVFESPTKRPLHPPSPGVALSLSAQRRDRRRTAPSVIGGDFAASMAQMAAALGEDVPVMFTQTPVQVPTATITDVDPMVVEEQAEEHADGTLDAGTPLGLADAMQQEQQQQQEEEKEEKEEKTVTAVKESSSSSSLVVLLEQAQRQARIQGSTTPDDSMIGDTSDSLGVSNKLAGLSVTSPPPTPLTATMPFVDAKLTLTSSSRKTRRQTIDASDITAANNAEEQEEEEEEVGSVDEILARRQRLRRIQERKRRRQTVADLNKRRSSWRGWVPPEGGGGANGRSSSPLLLQTEYSPPSSPTAATEKKCVAHHMADRSSFASRHVPAADIIASGNGHASSLSFSSLEDARVAASSTTTTTTTTTLVSAASSASTTAIITTDMYPPTAWNNNEKGEEGREPATRNRRRRRITEILASALGMSSNSKSAMRSSVELDNDPKHGSTRPAAKGEEEKEGPATLSVFAYPPKPVPIDAEWETVDRPSDFTADDDSGRRLPPVEEDVKDDAAAPELSQQVELYAVSGPGSVADDADIFSAQVPTEKPSKKEEIEEEAEPVVDVPPIVDTIEPSPIADAADVADVAMLSPPTTRGRASRTQRQASESVSPPKPPQPPPPPTRRRAVTASASSSSALATPAVTTTARKRRAEDPTPFAASSLPAAKRGRGRPPSKNPVAAGGGRRTIAEAPTSVISPPSTRASKRAKSHAT